MAGYQVIRPSDARGLDHAEITDIQVFDLLEYAANDQVSGRN
jgi:hypothetical protein